MWRYISRLGVVAMALATVACGSTPQHSNVLIFGTNTTFAIDASYNAASVPQVTIGYKRQEAVWLPLLANTGYDSQTGKPTPCGISATAKEVLACVYVGTDDKKTDTYSVMASFGADFSGSAVAKGEDGKVGPTAEAKSGIAQYFATGLAARTLAERAGAAAVATGKAAEANANMLAAIENAERGLPSPTISTTLTEVQNHVAQLFTNLTGNKEKLKVCNDAAIEAGFPNTLADGTKDAYAALRNFQAANNISESGLAIMAEKCKS